MQKLFLYFLFFLGFVPPVLIINPIINQLANHEAKMGFLHPEKIFIYIAIFIYTMLYMIAVLLIFEFSNINLLTFETYRFMAGIGCSIPLNLCLTNCNIWDYITPAIKATPLGTNKTEEKPREYEKKAEPQTAEPQTVEPPKTNRQNSIDDILEKLDNF